MKVLPLTTARHLARFFFLAVWRGSICRYAPALVSFFSFRRPWLPRVKHPAAKGEFFFSVVFWFFFSFLFRASHSRNWGVALCVCASAASPDPAHSGVPLSTACWLSRPNASVLHTVRCPFNINTRAGPLVSVFFYHHNYNAILHCCHRFDRRLCCVCC